MPKHDPQRQLDFETGFAFIMHTLYADLIAEEATPTQAVLVCQAYQGEWRTVALEALLDLTVATQRGNEAWLLAKLREGRSL